MHEDVAMRAVLYKEECYKCFPLQGNPDIIISIGECLVRSFAISLPASHSNPTTRYSQTTQYTQLSMNFHEIPRNSMCFHEPSHTRTCYSQLGFLYMRYHSQIPLFFAQNTHYTSLLNRLTCYLLSTIGLQAYKLELPPSYRSIHPVFHVSLLSFFLQPLDITISSIPIQY